MEEQTVPEIKREEEKDIVVIQVCVNGFMENCKDIDEALNLIRKEWEKDGFYFSGKKFNMSNNVVRDLQIERGVILRK